MRYPTVKARKSSQISQGWQHEKANGPQKDMVHLFDAASGRPHYDKSKSLWDTILEALNLPLCYQPAIASVLLENRWRSAENPRAYVATASWRKGLKLQLSNHEIPDIERVDIPEPSKSGLADTGKKSFLPESCLENFLYQNIGRHDDEQFPIPDWLRKKHESDEIDWGKIAKYSVIKPEMKDALTRVLQMRFVDGLSRDKAVATVACQDEKREVEAMWKWIDRNREERIAPLFRLDGPPSKAQKSKRVQGTRSRYIAPGEAIRRACEREKIEAPVWSLPSIMVDVGKFAVNTMHVDPSARAFRPATQRPRRML